MGKTCGNGGRSGSAAGADASDRAGRAAPAHFPRAAFHVFRPGAAWLRAGANASRSLCLSGGSDSVTVHQTSVGVVGASGAQQRLSIPMPDSTAASRLLVGTPAATQRKPSELTTPCMAARTGRQSPSPAEPRVWPLPPVLTACALAGFGTRRLDLFSLRPAGRAKFPATPSRETTLCVCRSSNTLHRNTLAAPSKLST